MRNLIPNIFFTKVLTVFIFFIFVMSIHPNILFASDKNSGSQDINVDHKFFCLASEYFVKSKENKTEDGVAAAANFCGNIKENVNMRITCLAMVSKDSSSLKKVCAEDFPLCHAFTSDKFKAGDCEKNFKGDLTSQNICLAFHRQDEKFCLKINNKDPLHYTCKAMLAPKADQCELITVKTKSKIFFDESPEKEKVLSDSKATTMPSPSTVTSKKGKAPRDVSSVQEKNHDIKINEHESFEFDPQNESILDEEL